MISPKVRVILTLASFCMGTLAYSAGNGNINSKMAQFRREIVASNLQADRQSRLLETFDKFLNVVRSRDEKAVLGSTSANRMYKAEADLLAAYFSNGLPLNSGLGVWLKNDMDSQVTKAMMDTQGVKGLNAQQKEARNNALNQLNYDLANLGGAIDTAKLLEHTGWLDNNFRGFENRPKYH